MRRNFLSALHGKPLDLLYAILVHKVIAPVSFFSRGWGNLRRVNWLKDRIHGVPWPPPYLTIPWKLLECGEYGGIRYHILEGRFNSPTSETVREALPRESLKTRVRLLLPINSWKDQIRCVLHLPGTGDQGFARRLHLAFPLLQHNIASLLLESPFYGSRRPAHQFGSRLQHVSDLLTLGRATIEESVALLYWAKCHGYGPLGVCGLSMGGVHSCMVASLYPESLACTPLLTPRSAAVAFCQGALQHGINNWNLLKQTTDNTNQDIHKTLTEADEVASSLRRMKAYIPDVMGTSWIPTHHGQVMELQRIIPQQFAASSLFYADDDIVDGVTLLTLLDALEREEALIRLQMVLETFTDVTQFPIPRRPDAAVFVAARDDAYALPHSSEELHRYWQGSELRWVSGGHVSAILFGAHIFCNAIKDSLSKLCEDES